jgi:hypothetical protein
MDCWSLLGFDAATAKPVLALAPLKSSTLYNKAVYGNKCGVQGYCNPTKSVTAHRLRPFSGLLFYVYVNYNKLVNCRAF